MGINRARLFLLLSTMFFAFGIRASEYQAQLRKIFVKVLACNSDLSSLEEQIASLKQQVDAKDVWPDPVFGVDYSNMPISTPYPGKHPMSGIQLSLRQRFPFFGKANLRADVASASVKVKKSQLLKEKNNILASISSAYISLLLNIQLKKITEEHLQTVKSLRQSVDSKYRIGKSRQFQLLRLMMLEEKIEDDLHQLISNERKSSERLNLAINCPSELTIDKSVEIPLPEPLKKDKDFLAKALQNQSPTLHEIQSKKDVESHKIKMFEREAYPDISTSVAFRFRSPIAGGDSGENFISAGISIPIPFFWNDARFGSQVRAAKNNTRALEHMYASRLQKDSRELESQIIMWRRQAQKAQTYEDVLIPAAKKTLESALSAYSVGQTEFTDVYLTELELLNFEREAVKARAAASEASITFDALMGNFTKYKRNGDRQ